MIDHHDPYARTSQESLKNEKATFDSFAKTARILREKLADGKIPAEDTNRVRSAANVMQMISEDSVANSAHIYDSVQHALPAAQRDSWLSRKALIQLLRQRDHYGAANMGYVMYDKFIHGYPKLFFLLLPFFALLLKWFFYRRKDLVYGDHAIFSIHMHTLAFMLGIITILIGLSFHGFAYYGVLALLIFLYIVFSIRNTYDISFGKSVLKTIGILAGYAVGTVIVLIFFLLLIFAFT